MIENSTLKIENQMTSIQNQIDELKDELNKRDKFDEENRVNFTF